MSPGESEEASSGSTCGRRSGNRPARRPRGCVFCETNPPKRHWPSGFHEIARAGAMPHIEAMDLVERFFHLGMRVVGSPNPTSVDAGVGNVC